MVLLTVCLGSKFSPGMEDMLRIWFWNRARGCGRYVWVGNTALLTD